MTSAPNRLKLAILTALLVITVTLTSPQAPASEEWKTEYEEVCGKTDLLGDMPPDALQHLLTRAEKLAASIPAQNETARKVTAKRLKACRDMIQFMLDAKMEEKSGQ